MGKLQFVNFIRRIIKTYKVFPNHNPEIGTGPSMGKSDSHLADFFSYTTLIHIRIFQADVAPRKPLVTNMVFLT